MKEIIKQIKFGGGGGERAETDSSDFHSQRGYGSAKGVGIFVCPDGLDSKAKYC